MLAGHDAAAARANQLLQAYRGYLGYPNRDNVLGPSRLFFSTYLESIWVGNYLAAATLLREAGLLDDATAEVVASVADEAANLIGEFDEGLSNRQTWHNAALASIAVWFEDEDLASRVIEGGSGVVAHLLHGFGEDGMWYEGDNYHLFALRGQLLAMWWARQAGVDLLADPRLTGRLSRRSGSRGDRTARLHLSCPQGLALRGVAGAADVPRALGDRIGQARRSRAMQALWSWLRQLYRSPAPKAQTFDSYLHEAGEPDPGPTRTRCRSFLVGAARDGSVLPSNTPPWAPGNVFVEGQGLAVLRRGNRYASLEAGGYGGGHGHPDRLNLVVHSRRRVLAAGLRHRIVRRPGPVLVPSTLAHNAPRLDGVSQAPEMRPVTTSKSGAIGPGPGLTTATWCALWFPDRPTFWMWSSSRPGMTMCSSCPGI